MNSCSIIIPVYNAYDCLKPCIESVIKHTDLEKNSLVLINDCSTDERVLPLLLSYKSVKGITVLDNSENLGFVRTANKGIANAGSNDVLLLNSDTEVTARWLEKIQNCAYSHKMAATVTPLSNNATLASVPNAFVPNDIPEGFDLDSFADFVEKKSLHKYPEIPTGHGFCLYIKRIAIDKVGMLDEESFGKGYGEENDFCFRCLDVGFVHLLCDDTYIYHKESQSFTSSKEKELKQGLEILAKKYSYMDGLDLWVASKEISYIGDNLKFEMSAYNDKPNILFLIHGWDDASSKIGGTTLHAKDIISKLLPKYNFHVLYPQNGAFAVSSYCLNFDTVTTAYFSCDPKFSNSCFYNPDYKRMAEKIIDIYGISAVHIHHLLNQYFDMIDVCKEKNVKVIATLHDYYFVCPSVNKLYMNESYCGDGSEEKCKKCLANRYASTLRAGNFVNSWREISHSELKKCDLLIAPSIAARDEIKLHYSDLDISVIEHGINIEKTVVTPHNDGKFNIAFIGGIAIHKGRRILQKLAKNIRGIKVHLFGISDVPIVGAFNFKNHGKYKREDLPKLFDKWNIDLVCLFSIWPETYSYTLTEAISCGVPAIAFDFGAVAERIKKYNLGYLVPVNATSRDIIKKICEIRKNKEEYNEKLKSIAEYKIKTTAEMGEEYDAIYSEFTVPKMCDTEKIKEAMLFGKSQSVSGVFDELSYMNQSLKWRIVSKIRFPKVVGRITRRLLRR